ncbi:hypothetical protein EVAR_69725_1 [Eumeta japonica]|uniref:Uncharacterized protein n=1 Tax=Eumeta variegata TaxID=151549 RepID=A0A4C2A0G4_EUMVA|nr:hypothetical protein EVAR_69725_1 [Eumeta japonica]
MPKGHGRFELKHTLMVWNSCLAAFSIMGACRTLPEFIHVLRNYGVYHSICVPRYGHASTSYELFATQAAAFDSETALGVVSYRCAIIVRNSVA